MVSDVVFTQHDRRPATAKGSGNGSSQDSSNRRRSAITSNRVKQFSNSTTSASVGLGSYNIDIHHVERLAINASWVKNEGWAGLFPHFPFELPLGMLLPRRAEAANLLVPVAVSASHVGFNCLRLEPTWSILGQAAGTAAALAVAAGISAIQDLPVAALQQRLRHDGQLLTADDVPARAPTARCQ